MSAAACLLECPHKTAQIELGETRAMTAAAPFDFTTLLAPGLPPPAVKWTGFPRHNFVGGHNDPEQVPVATASARMHWPRCSRT
jgi:hypothetical protein